MEFSRQEYWSGLPCPPPGNLPNPGIEPAAAATAKSLQSCLTLCDPIDGSQPGSPVPGILQARTLGWVAISFSNAWKWKVKVKSLSRVWLCATPWTTAYQGPPSMGFSRQEYWSGVPLPSLGIEPRSPILQADSLPAEPQWKSRSTGVGSLSLLQRIFQIQELNQGSPALLADSLPTELSGKST